MMKHFNKLRLSLNAVFALCLLFRMVFCSESMEDLQLHPTQEKIFVRCDVNAKKMKRKNR